MNGITVLIKNLFKLPKNQPNSAHLLVFRAFFFLVLCTISSDCFATFQRKHLIRIGNDTLPILSEIQELSLYQSWYEFYRTPGVFSTNCYIGYYVLLELKQDSLYLDAIIECVTEKKLSLEKLAGKNPRFGSWFTGSIKLGVGNSIGSGFFIAFEKYRILEISEGIVKEDSLFDNVTAWKAAEKKQQFWRLAQMFSDTLTKHLDKHASDFIFCDSSDFHKCEEEYMVKISPSGKVKFVQFYLDLEKPYVSHLYGIVFYGCRNRLKRAVKSLSTEGLQFPDEPIYLTIFPLCIDGKVQYYIKLHNHAYREHLKKT